MPRPLRSLLPILLTGCGLSDLLPTGPVLDAEGRAWFDVREPSPVTYTGPPQVDYPVLPLQVWGLRYALDVVIRTTNPDWDMHEYALIQTPQGPLWLAKDANAAKQQHITAAIPGLQSWAPEVPAPRTVSPLEVVDQSTAEDVSLEFRYTNPLQQEVVVRVEGKRPTEPSPKRNGNTMGHSADIAAVLLDLHLFGPARRVDMTIQGERQRIKRVLGLYPMKLIIAQTQGGLAIADARMRPAPGGFQLDRPGGDRPWNTTSSEAWYIDGDPGDPGDPGSSDLHVRTGSDLLTLDYHFLGYELADASVWQYAVPFPVTNLAFRPALPDLRRPFSGTATSRFVVDISGQQAHGVGTVQARREGDEIVLDIQPEAPAWFAARPMQARIRFEGDQTILTVIRK